MAPRRPENAPWNHFPFTKAQSSVLFSPPQLILLGKQYTDVGCSLASWLNQSLQVEAIQQFGDFAVPPLVRQQLGEGYSARMRTGPPCCVTGKAMVGAGGSSEGCAMPIGAIATQTSSVISILQHHPTSDGASHPLPHGSCMAWHTRGGRTENQNQVPSVGVCVVFLRKQPSPFRFDFHFPWISTCERIGYLGSKLRDGGLLRKCGGAHGQG